MRISRLVLMTVVPMLTVKMAAVPEAAGATTLRAGAADSANAVFVFDEHTKPRTIVLQTTRVGVAGSRIEVTVDKGKTPVFSHVFAPGECKFGDRGSACEVVIRARDPAYRAIVARFRRGRVARVAIQDAGVMKMDQTVSLSGFANALR